MCDCEGQTDIGRYLSRIGGQAGDRLTGYGQAFGSSAAKRFKAWTGLGDYQLHGNSLISGSGATGQPQIRNAGRAVIIRYKEYIGEVVTSPSAIGAFNVTSYRINPADIASFPWLAPIAQQFDQYQPLGILFEFKSTATDYTATTASLGSVIMMTEYDVRDEAPEAKGEMLNSAYSQESKMSEHAVHGIECDPGELQRSIFYCKSSDTVAVGDDNRDYDVGTFNIATQGGGLPVGQSVGSLYVHYEFAFFKEQPQGGIFNKSWPWYARDTQVALATQLKLFEIGGSTSTLIGGEDMGITFVQTGLTGSINIPRRWQGAYLRFKWAIRASPPLATSPTLSLVVTTQNQCSIPSDLWMSRYTVSGGPPFQFRAQGTSTTVLEMYVKCNDVMTSNGQLVLNDPLVNYPLTSAYSCFVCMELLNEGYFEA